MSIAAQIAATESKAYYSPSNLARLTKKNVLSKSYAPLIDTYRGWIPRNVGAVRIQIESWGNPKAGPVGSGKETGLLQVWLCRPPSCKPDYGLTLQQAYNPATNLKYGFTTWQKMASRLQSRMSRKYGLLKTRNADFWAIVQLATAVGAGAAERLLKASGARPGREYRDLLAWVKNPSNHGRMYSMAINGAFGSQSAEKVAHRVVAMGRMIEAAKRLPGGLPASSLAAEGTVGGLATLALVGAGGYLFMKYANRKGWI